MYTYNYVCIYIYLYMYVCVCLLYDWETLSSSERLPFCKWEYDCLLAPWLWISLYTFMWIPANM